MPESFNLLVHLICSRFLLICIRYTNSLDTNLCDIFRHVLTMMTSSNGTIFRATGPLCGEFTDHSHKRQRRGPLMFSLICAWTTCWVNNRDAGDLRRHHAHYDVTVMVPWSTSPRLLPRHKKTQNHLGLTWSDTDKLNCKYIWYTYSIFWRLHAFIYSYWIKTIFSMNCANYRTIV